MLNERQFALLDALESQPAALSGLAQHTGVSARTILRDIDYINFTLSGTARIRATGSALYQLEIADRKQYFRLLQRHDNDDRLLALLLIRPVMSRAQLADALNLPDPGLLSVCRACGSAMRAHSRSPAVPAPGTSLMSTRISA